MMVMEYLSRPVCKPQKPNISAVLKGFEKENGNTGIILFEAKVGTIQDYAGYSRKVFASAVLNIFR